MIDQIFGSGATQAEQLGRKSGSGFAVESAGLGFTDSVPAENRFNSLGCEIPKLYRGDFGTERKNPTPNDEFPVLRDINAAVWL